MPGWDCHGLPIEWKIEEQYRAKGLNKDAVDVVDFRQECRSFAEGWIDTQRDEFKRLGVTGNWADPYLTMDYHAERVIAEEFMKFLMNGTLYQGSKPVMWSPVEKTALAEAEIEYHDHKSHTIWVPFEVVATETDESAKLRPDIRTECADPRRQSTLCQSDHLDHDAVDDPLQQGGGYNPTLSYGLYEVTATQEECWAKVGDRLPAGRQRLPRRCWPRRLEPGMWRRVRA